MTKMIKYWLLLGFGLLLSQVCATELDVSRLSMKNAKAPFPQMVTGGQPSAEDLKILQQQGVVQIINLRTKGEFDEFDEAAVAESLGMSYQVLEIAGAEGISLENAQKLDQLLATNQGATLLHCASSNRVGALLAIRAGAIQGKSVEEALVEGKNAGLGSLYDRTQTLLQSLKP